MHDLIAGKVDLKSLIVLRVDQVCVEEKHRSKDAEEKQKRLEIC